MVLKTLRRRLARGGSQRMLAIATIEAVVAAMTFAATEFWLVPLVQLRLGAGAQAVGLLAILPLLAVGLTGPWLGRVIAAGGGERRMLITGVSIQGLVMLALVWLQIWPGPWAVPLAVGLTVLVGLAGAIAGAAWVGLVANALPPSLSGRYTAERLRLFLAAKLCCAAVFALIARSFPFAESAVAGVIVFGIAALARLLSAWLFLRVEDLPPRCRRLAAVDPETVRLGLPALLRGRFLGPRDFRRWNLLWAGLHVGVALAGPYFAPYMLSAGPAGLGLGSAPLQYWMLMQVGQVTRLAILPAAGRAVDRYGATAMLRLSLLGIVVIPLVWTFTRSLPLLMAMEVVSGVAWCLAECAVSVLLFNCASDPVQRGRLIGLHQAMVSGGFVIGGLAGGALIGVLPELGGSPYPLLFLLSAALRLPALIGGLILLPRLDLRGHGGQRGLWRVVLGQHPTLLAGLRGLPRFLRRP